MNSDTHAPSGMSLLSMPSLNAQVANTCVWSTGPPLVRIAHDVEVGEGHDQREQHGDGDDVAHHRQRDEPQLLPPVGAVDRRGLVELLRHRLERGEVHDHEERRADPDVHQDHGEARPVRIAQPRHRIHADALQQPVERAVGRVEQPQPGERAHRRRDDPGMSSMPRHLRCPLAGTLCTKCATKKPISALKHHRAHREDDGLLDHHPEGLALEQEGEVRRARRSAPSTCSASRGRTEYSGGIEHQQADDQHQRQRHRERDGGLAPQEVRSACACVGRTGAAARVAIEPSTIEAASRLQRGWPRRGSGAHEAFQLRRGPGDDLVHGARRLA